MTDHEQLANKASETLIDRGIDFIIKEAKIFVEDNNLHELSKSQIYGLSGQVVKSKDYADLKKKVEKWLNDQSKKKTGEKWKSIKEELLKRMFEWNDDRLENISELAKRLIGKRFNNAIDNNLNARNLSVNLKFKLANNFFNAVLSYYRCYEDKEIREIGGMEL